MDKALNKIKALVHTSKFHERSNDGDYRWIHIRKYPTIKKQIESLYTVQIAEIQTQSNEF